MSFHAVPELIADLKQGRMVIIVDDESRENEGDLVLSTDFVTPSAINFMSSYAKGLICVTLTHQHVEQLGLSLMVDHEKNSTAHKTAFTVSVEAASGVSTGISAKDRARTVQAISSPSALPTDIVSPGHVFPIRSQKGGVLKRAGHTEASVDLCRLAGLNPSAVICEIINEDGTMARVPELKDFAQKHQIKMGTIEDLIRHRVIHESFVEEKIKIPFPSDIYPGFHVHVFQDEVDHREHLVFSKGAIDNGQPVLVRMHSACPIEDVFSGQMLRSENYLRFALRKIHEAGRGVLVYLCLAQKSGRLAHRVQHYAQNGDTRPRMWMDQKNYGVGAQILRSLGVSKIILLTHFSTKRVGLGGYGLEIVKTLDIETGSVTGV